MFADVLAVHKEPRREATGLDYFIFIGVLTVPFLPKIGFAPGFYLNLFDLIIISVFPLFLLYDKYLLALPSQRYILAMWLIMAVLVGTYWLFGPSTFSPVTDVLRILKRVAYVPIIYVGYKLYSDRLLLITTRIGCLAILSALLFFFIYIWDFRFQLGSSWNPSLIFNGLSSRYIDMSGRLNLIVGGGSHGIWGTYSALVLVLAFCARRLGRMHTPEFVLIALLALFSIAMTPSRESILLITIFLLLATFRSIDFRRASVGRDARLGLSLVVLSLLIAIIFAGDLAIVAKLQYTADSVESTGTEGNIGIRLLIWRDTLAAMVTHPVYFIGGTGIYVPTFAAAVEGLGYGAEQRRGMLYGGEALESIPMEALAFGGVWALGVVIALSVHLWRLSGSGSHPLFGYFRLFLVGAFITNTFSGGALFSDEVYAWFLLTLGFLYAIAINHES